MNNSSNKSITLLPIIFYGKYRKLRPIPFRSGTHYVTFCATRRRRSLDGQLLSLST